MLYNNICCILYQCNKYRIAPVKYVGRPGHKLENGHLVSKVCKYRMLL